jgi:hypothetical protein
MREGNVIIITVTALTQKGAALLSLWVATLTPPLTSSNVQPFSFGATAQVVRMFFVLTNKCTQS